MTWWRTLPSGSIGSSLGSRALGWRHVALCFFHLFCFRGFQESPADPNFRDGGISNIGFRYCFCNCLQMLVLYWAQHRGTRILILELLSAAQGSGTFNFVSSIGFVASLDCRLHVSQIFALHALKSAATLCTLFRLLSPHDGWHFLGPERFEPLFWLHRAVKLLQELWSQQFHLIEWLNISLICEIHLYFQNWVADYPLQLKINPVDL